MSRFFINRPIVAMVIAILTVILGVIALVTLPVAQYPEIVPPEVTIGATYLGGMRKPSSSPSRLPSSSR